MTSSLTCTLPASTSTTATSATPAPILLRASLRVLHLPELLNYIGQFLSQRDALACVRVCRTWLHAFEPLVWEHIETANKIPTNDLERHAHEIRTLSLAGLVGMDRVLKRCTRLETVILWPDAFDEEEGDTDEEEDDADVEEEEDEEELSEDDEADQRDTLDDDDLVDLGCDGGLQGNVHGEEDALLLRAGGTRSAGGGAGEGAGAGYDDEGSGSNDDESDGNEGEDVPAGGRDTDREKLRRDSGVGQDTLEADVAMLGINDASAMAIASSEFLDQQQQSSPAGFWPQKQQLHPTHRLPQRWHRRAVYQSPLATLLLQNRNLRRVEVYVERKSPGGSFWRALAASPKPTKDDQTAFSPLATSRCSTSRSSFCPCPRLSAFQSLVNLQVHKHIDSFLQMCTRLETLDLERCTLRQLDPDGYRALWFPRLRELKFGRIREMSLLSQLLLMRQCPELEVLDWRVPHLGFPVDEFCLALEEGCWPKLKSLTLPESRLRDEELARILNGAADRARSVRHAVASSSSSRTSEAAGKAVAALGVMEAGSWRAFTSPSSWPSASLHVSTVSPADTGLSTFAVRRSDFGPLAFTALKRHFATIQFLDLYQCPALTSAMTQKILMSCRLLECFDGNYLLAKDIVRGVSSALRWPLAPQFCFGAGASGTTSNTEWTTGHHYGQLQQQEGDVTAGWVCKGLRCLDVHITGFSGAGISTCMDVEVNDENANVDDDTILDVNDGDDNCRVREHGKGGKMSFGERQMQWTVFSQLARLNQLVHLSIGGKSTLGCATTTTNALAGMAGTPQLPLSSSPSSSLSSSAPGELAAANGAGASEVRSGGVGGVGLDLRLCSGLGQLRTLRKLRMLRFTGLKQQMEQEDVAWMVEQLPELRVLQGRLHPDANRQAALETRLEAGGVSAWTMYD
ncbi:hypothetical protein BGZ72_009445 [Mortierella alpina]|nr:hypothetical protein BGZ72_009445 [Mortierella alpina]